jgi:hypothetical protein
MNKCLRDAVHQFQFYWSMMDHWLTKEEIRNQNTLHHWLRQVLGEEAVADLRRPCYLIRRARVNANWKRPE